MNVSESIAQHAKNRPDHPALHFRGTPITYRELEDKINRCAQSLHDLGIKKGSTFGIVLRNCPEFIILAMALAKLGAVAVPINFLEKADRLALILDDAGAVGVLTAKEFYRHVATAAKSVKTLKHFYFREGSHKEFKDIAELLSGKPWSGEIQAREDDLMMLLYTSGTTGLPKGVQLTHKNFIANTAQCLESIKATEKDRFMCLLPLFHSFGWTTCFLVPMSLGTSTVLIETLLPFDPVIKAVWNYKITIFVAVPQIYSALTAKIKGVKALFLRVLNPIRVCISGAAPLLPNVHHDFEHAFHVPLLEGYGLTEASPVVAFNPVNKRKVNTVGLPLPGVSVKIVDENEKDLPQGAVGEIFVKGDNVMKGYYHKPKETADAFSKDGWLRTGDLGRFDEEGYLSIVDRKKDLIIVKGLNVYPQEIESVISKHPSVKEVAVVGKMDRNTGEEQIRAFVTIQEGQSFDKSALHALCREHLAAYKIPRDIIAIDQMPKNALQKILKKDLRER